MASSQRGSQHNGARIILTASLSSLLSRCLCSACCEAVSHDMTNAILQQKVAVAVSMSRRLHHASSTVLVQCCYTFTADVTITASQSVIMVAEMPMLRSLLAFTTLRRRLSKVTTWDSSCFSDQIMRERAIDYVRAMSQAINVCTHISRSTFRSNCSMRSRGSRKTRRYLKRPVNVPMQLQAQAAACKNGECV